MSAITQPNEDPGVIPERKDFLGDPQAWTERLAIARRGGVPELTPGHRLIIRALRAHYRRFGAAPPAFIHLCHRHCLGRHGVERLFGSTREAWRIAGLPDPGEETKAYTQ